jgi:hypothetical protein
MSSNKQVVRFAVVDDQGCPLSSIWRIWSSGGETYIAVRSLANEFKTSLHKSGKYRHAFVNQGASDRFRTPGVDRAVHKWERPAEHVPGAALLFQVVLPEPGLAAYLPSYQLPDSLFRLTRPAPGRVLYVSVVESAPGVETKGPTFADQPTTVISAWPMPSGETVWVVSHDAPMTDDNTRSLQELKKMIQGATSTANLLDAVGEPRSELRGFFLLSSPDGVGRVVDLSLEFLRR